LAGPLVENTGVPPSWWEADAAGERIRQWVGAGELVRQPTREATCDVTRMTQAQLLDALRASMELARSRLRDA
jgi:hypothetical protein